MRLKNKLLRITRKLLESFGVFMVTTPARHNLDYKLSKYLPKEGVFIEAGAADGFTESNTYFLEKFNNWTGILVEPVYGQYRQCVKERPKSKVFNCALVSFDYPHDTIKLLEGSLMSTVKGALGEDESVHINKAKYFHGSKGEEIVVRARTLTSILKESGVDHIDFLSLDVEGYESNVLKGLDFDIYKPKYILVEILDERKKKDIDKVLSFLYYFVEKLSKRDYLYTLK